MLCLCVVQVKPLLQVTNTEEKLNVKEQELKQVADRFEKLKFEHEDLEKKQQQMIEEKNALAEQLQAEAELAAEAEEVCSSSIFCHLDSEICLIFQPFYDNLWL